MNIPFQKYQGTGNDFVMIDQRTEQFIHRSDTDLIALLCDRKFGIGADGLILLQNIADFDFEMIYFNADGHESSMCGNGGRCITAFAKALDIFDKTCTFKAIDGAHKARFLENGTVALEMSDVSEIEIGEDYFVLDTGSPHYIVFAEDVDDINVKETGSAIRYSTPYRKEGINVNFVEKTDHGLKVVTYERGVEDETLSCGTGVTAAALAHAVQFPNKTSIPIQTKGGQLTVEFQKGDQNDSFTNIWLIGPATKVFTGLFTYHKTI